MFDQQNNVPSGSLRDCQDVPRRIVGSEMQQNFNEKIFNSSNCFFLYGKQQKLSQPPRVGKDEEERRLWRITSSLRMDSCEKGLLCRADTIFFILLSNVAIYKRVQ